MKTFAPHIIAGLALSIASCTTHNSESSSSLNLERSTVELTCSPMIGHVSMRGASVWAQATGPDVALNLHVSPSNGNQETLVTAGTTSDIFHTVTFDIGGLEPGTTYKSWIDHLGRTISDTIRFTTQPLWDFRTDPPPFKVITGSCAYINEPEYDRPGDGYGGDYQIFEAMADENPDMMLWLGDNVYLREVDFQSIHGYAHRYSHMRATPEMQNLLCACPHYAIWDDHDFGPNDCDGSWVHQDWAQQAFESFWANPTYGVPNRVHGIATAFRFIDMDFFLLDNRTHRVNHHMKTAEPQMLGQHQIDWLIEALRGSRAPFKFVAVGGQVVSDAAIYENMAQFPEERDALLSRIDEEGIRGVVFLTGDRHNTELSRIELPNGGLVYDLTASPMTSGSYDHTDEPNHHRVDGSMVGVRNYAALSFTGSRKDRKCDIEIRDSAGELIWTYTLAAKDWAEANQSSSVSK